jgi:hypothetical protein
MKLQKKKTKKKKNGEFKTVQKQNQTNHLTKSIKSGDRQFTTRVTLSDMQRKTNVLEYPPCTG